jgi:hypothetical protein
MKLVEYANKWYKVFSVQAQLISTSLLGTYALLPSKLQESLPMGLILSITIGILILGTIGSLVKQDNVTKQ